MKKLFYLICILLLLFSCSVENHNNGVPEKCFDLSNEKDRIYIEDKGNFWELYKIENLKKCSVYVSENIVNFNFYFSKDVNVTSIKNTQTFFSHVITKTSKKYPSAYEDIDKFIKNDTIVKLRIFVNNRILLYTSFDFKINEFDYYENIDIDIDRTIGNVDVENFVKDLKSINKNIENVKIFKALKGSVVCVVIDTKSKIDKIQEAEICKYVESKIAPEFEKLSKDLYGINMDALGVYLEIRFGNIKIFEGTYFNGDKKRWANIDWYNFDFFNLGNEI
ncbi:hypothetical protein E4O04_04895 [Treponema sp. OMZ 799]|uniref:hypothetical protein n=1 Tax=Treponema sp. OMZ 799 TaxID=2563668 RepID=UPI0020A360D5|nr:hypothetical protein [Treponema sp. OMZ 799]UTC77374.1 hypothetical protein E4O04_04895 [Treponema sp. OMZ 799]